MNDSSSHYQKEPQNFRRLNKKKEKEKKEKKFSRDIAAAGSGSLRLRGCNKRADFQRNDRRLTNRGVVLHRPAITLDSPFSFLLPFFLLFFSVERETT